MVGVDPNGTQGREREKLTTKTCLVGRFNHCCKSAKSEVLREMGRERWSR